MPAQLEEQKMALADGVVFCELLAPETWDGSILTCEKMLLGDYDSSGRRSIKGTGIKQEFNFDTVISATGAGIETELFTHNNITVKGGFPSVNSSLESSLPDVYIAGDCLKGASTVVNAIADGKTAAADILKKLKLTADFIRPPVSCPGSLDKINDADLYIKKGIIVEAKNDDSENLRCLSCNVLCEICADVCPNRANVSVILPAYGKRPKTRQIVHIDRMCNECGNCATFCPYSGKPYRDKFTVFSNQEDFNDSENPGFVKTDDSYNIRLEDKSIVEYMLGEKNIPYEYAFLLETLNTDYEYILI
jgi:putative selenate reductase